MENQIKISELRSKAWDLMQAGEFAEASELYNQCLLWYPPNTSHPNYSTNDKQHLTKLFFFCREMMKQEAVA